MDTLIVDLRTGAELVTDVTGEVRKYCHGHGDGLCHLFVPHATAGLALIETGSGTESDLAAAIDRLLPREDIYRHRHGSTGHGRDHVLPALVSPSLTLPVLDGEPALGTWQSVVVVDSNADNPQRRLRLSFLPADRAIATVWPAWSRVGRLQDPPAHRPEETAMGTTRTVADIRAAPPNR